MKISELAKESGWQVFSEGEDRAVESGYCGDFLSNIISRAPDSCAWLTVMNNVNVAAVATLIDCACIVLCEGVAGERVRGGKEGGCDLRGVIGVHKFSFELTKENFVRLRATPPFKCFRVFCGVFSLFALVATRRRRAGGALYLPPRPRVLVAPLPQKSHIATRVAIFGGPVPI